MQKESTTNRRSEANSIFHEIRNDRLSVNGAQPRRGDIVQSISEEGAEGELHLVNDGSTVHIGYLYRKPSSLILKFPNPNVPDEVLPATSEVRKVVCFYYRQETLIPKKKKARKAVGSVVDFAAWKEGRI